MHPYSCLPVCIADRRWWRGEWGGGGEGGEERGCYSETATERKDCSGCGEDMVLLYSRDTRWLLGQ